LRDADLYEDEEEITLEEIMAEVNLEQSAADDDSEVVDGDESLGLEETLDLSNSHFLQNATTPVEHDENDDSVDFDNWLVELDKEDDYNPTELAKMFLK
jgi:hypothetical protein